MSNGPIEQPSAVDHKRAGNGERRGRVAVGALLLALVVMLVLVSTGDEQIATGSDGRLHREDIPGWPPDTTTTGLSAAPGAALTATSDTLRLEVTLETPDLLTADILRIHVRATDGDVAEARMRDAEREFSRSRFSSVRNWLIPRVPARVAAMIWWVSVLAFVGGAVVGSIGLVLHPTLPRALSVALLVVLALPIGRELRYAGEMAGMLVQRGHPSRRR